MRRMACSGEGVKPHALFVSAPWQGHVVPGANLAVKLAAEGFIITFATKEFFHHTRTASGASSSSADQDDDMFADARSEGLDIRYQLVHDGVDWGSSDMDRIFEANLHSLSAHVEELLQKLLLAEPPVNALVADTFFVWPSALAKKYDLPCALFCTQSAFIFNIAYHTDLLIANGYFATDPEKRKDTIIRYMPGIPMIASRDLFSNLQGMDTSGFMHQFITTSLEDIKGADFVLANTVQELEEEEIAVVNQEKPFYAVGPISPSGFTRQLVEASLRPQHDYSRWLDSLPPASVIYVSFGSLVFPNKRDLVEIAYGVLNSKVNFLWAFRPSNGDSMSGDLLPDGYMEASKGRGLVVPWCNQKEVLLHPAVGGFLTHCGWNSILESMWCGVPMLGFPIMFDQPTNRMLLCRKLGIGIEVGDIGEVCRDQVSNAIISLMGGGDDGVVVRREMEKVKMAVRTAVTPEGSSTKNLKQFTLDLTKHLKEKSTHARAHGHDN